MPRSTVHDVARAAGVSLATVDRVLNRRPGVRSQTISRVEAAALEVNYSRDVAAANLARRREYPMLFVIPSGSNSFMRGLEREIDRGGAQFAAERVHIDVATVPAMDADALARVIDNVDPAVHDALAFVAVDAPPVRAATDRLSARGVPAATLVSDLPGSSRVHYCGVDNVRAGRTAAGLLGRFVSQPGAQIAILSGSPWLNDHSERKSGFEAVMAADFPHLDLLPVMQGQDDSEVTETIVTQLLSERPELAGLYNLGAGNRGVIRALRKSRRAGKVKVIAHELTDHAREALETGLFEAVINQDAGRQVRSAVRVLKARLDERPVIADQERIRIDIFLRDNMP